MLIEEREPWVGGGGRGRVNKQGKQVKRAYRRRRAMGGGVGGLRVVNVVKSE